jgi:dCTP deaminase
MVLTDREIEVAIQTKQISITPTPNELAYSSTSLDLTLSTSLRLWRTPKAKGVEQIIISPAASGYVFNDVAKEHSEPKEMDSSGYILEPRDFVLGWTEEYVTLPAQSRIAARVEGKSALARLGIGIHITAPTIHAGFQGKIQLEICNHGTLRVRLLPGMRVCQLIFEQTAGTPEKGYAGQFAGQTAK